MNNPLKLHYQPDIKNSSLIVFWDGDTASLGTKVTDYLIDQLNGQCFCEIEPTDFFPLSRVTIENDLVRFPESKFYAFPDKELIVFKSSPPSYEWYQFLTLVLDVAQEYGHVRELFANGEMFSLSAHTAPRELMGIFNSAEQKNSFAQYNLTGGFNYETPPGQRPTLNSFLLWVAKRRNIPGTTLMVLVPFYLLALDDPKSQSRTLELFNQRLNLGIDFSDLNQQITMQNEKIDRLRTNVPEIDESISRLEGNLGLSAEANQQLVDEIRKSLGKQHN